MRAQSWMMIPVAGSHRGLGRRAPGTGMHVCYEGSPWPGARAPGSGVGLAQSLSAHVLLARSRVSLGGSCEEGGIREVKTLEGVIREVKTLVPPSATKKAMISIGNLAVLVSM
jgi:hypothetical protein